MTFLRRLALKISNTVVEYASPGSKEWAEGLAQETAFVEGDWAALVWALGNVRVLFDYREAPMGSLAEIPATAWKFAESQRNRYAAGIVALLGCILSNVHKFFRARNWLQHLGCSLVTLGALSIGIVIFIKWRKRLKLPASDDNIAFIQFYRAWLERYLNYSRIIFLAIIFFCAGFPLVWDAPVGLLWMSIVLLVLVALLVLQRRRILQRRLERLDALLAERPCDR